MASNVSVTTTTDYDGSYIYENGALSKVLTPEGYIAGGSYHYFEKDHLGNTRIVLKAVQSPSLGGVGEVSQVTDYYPFGMEISDPIRTVHSQQSQVLPTHIFIMVRRWTGCTG